MVSSPAAPLTCAGEGDRSGVRLGEKRWKLLWLVVAGTGSEEEEEEGCSCSAAKSPSSSREELSTGSACSLCN